MFGKGRPYGDSYFGDFRKKVRVTKDFRHFVEKLKRRPAFWRVRSCAHARLPVQQGYVYFQDFMADNREDIRVTVIGNRAFGFHRRNRPGDFLRVRQRRVALRCPADRPSMRSRGVRRGREAWLCQHGIRFSDGQRWGSENRRDQLYLCRGGISYRPGHWDRTMNWHEGHVWPQDAIFDDFLAALEKRRIDRNDSDHGLKP